MIARYLGPAFATGGAVSTGTGSAVGYTLHTYTATGGSSFVVPDLGTRLRATINGDLSGDGVLVFAGPGILTLSGSNSYTGGTTLAGGTVSLASAAALGTTGPITFSGGALQFTAANTTDYSSRFSTAGGQSYALDTNGQNVSLAAPLTSAGGSLTKLGTGRLTLSASNSFSGATRVAAGTLVLGTTQALAGSTLDLAAGDAGAIDLAVEGAVTYALGGLQGSRSLALGANSLSIGGNGQSTTYSGAIAGSGGIVKTGAGTLTLAGSNAFTGGTTLAGGTLALGAAGALGTTGSITFAGGVLQFTSANTSDVSSRFSAAADQAYAIDTGGQSVTLAAPLMSDGGSLTKLGAGTLTLSGSNSYSGSTTISAGTLIPTTTASLPGSATPGRVALNGGTLQLAVGATAWTSAQVDALVANAATTSGAIALDVAGGSQSLAGAISGGIGLTKLGAGTLALSGSNSYTGGTTLSAGTLVLASADAIGGSGPISFGGGVLQFTEANAADYSSRFSAAANQAHAIDTGGQSVTFAAPLASPGGSLTKLGVGTLVLAAGNTYGGMTTVSGGTLAIGAGGATGSIAGNATVAGGAALVFNRANDVTYGGSIGGAGDVTKQGAGTLTLTAANTFTGSTRVGSGTLALGHASALAGSTLDLADGDAGTVAFTVPGTATYALGGLQGGRDLALGGNSVSIGANGASTTYSGGLSGAGGLTKVGAGTLILAGSSSYQGQTAVTRGRLVLAGSLAGAGASPLITVAPSSGQTASLSVQSGTVAPGGSGGLVVGDAGSGQFDQTGGSVALGTGGLWIGKSTGGSGFATISGGTFVSAAAPTNVGNGSLVVSGSANVTLAGLGIGSVSPGTTSNVSITGGRLAVDAAFPTGPNARLVMDGGTLAARGDAAAFVTGLSAASIFAGGGAIDTSGFAVTVPQGFDGVGGLTKVGAGTLALTGNNSFTGGTVVSSGTLDVGNGGTTGSIVGNVVNNAALRFNRSDATSFGGSISGTGSLTKLGAGTLTLSASNAYTGGTEINGGVLALGSAGAIGPGGTISLGGGTLQFSEANTTDYSGRFSTGANQSYRIDTNGQNVTFAAALTSTGGSLTKLGTGTLALTGSNSYTGNTTISQGVLVIPSSSSLPGYATPGRVSAAAGAGLTVGNAVDNVAVGQILATGSFASGAILGFDTSAGNRTYSGAITGPIGLVKTGSNTLTLEAVNPYTGGTVVNGGTLAATFITAASLGGGTNPAVAVNAGAALTLSSVAAVFPSNAAAVTLNDGATLNLSALISGTGFTNARLTRPVNVSGSSTINLAFSSPFGLRGTGFLLNSATAANVTVNLVVGGTAANSQEAGWYVFQSDLSGPAQLAAGSVLTIIGGTTRGGVATVTFQTGTAPQLQAMLATTDVVFGGAPVKVNLGNSGSNVLQVNSLAGGAATRIQSDNVASTLRINNGTGTGATFAGSIIDGDGAGQRMAVVKAGTGTQIFSGSNSYTGGTTVSSGTLDIGGGGTTGSIVGNVVNNAALRFNRSDAVTVSGVISGSGSVTKLGAGTLTLTGSSSYLGRTIVNAGTVQVSGTGGAGGSAAALGTGTVAIGTGGQVTYWLSLSGSHTIANPFSLTGGTLYTEDGSNTFSGPITLAGGSSTIAARYADTITLSGGLAGSGNVLFTQSGDAGVDVAPAYVLSAPGSNTGTVRVSGSANGSGTKLRLANVNALQNATLDLAAGDLGVVEFTVAGTNTYVLGGLQGSRNLAIGPNTLSIGGGGGSTTYAGGIAGSGGFTKTGTGTLTLTGSNSSSGRTAVTGGTLLLAGGSLGNGSADGTNRAINIGVSSGQTAALTVQSGTIAQSGNAGMVVGDAGTGTFNQTGGVVTLGASGLYVGDFSPGVGTMNLLGGTFTSTIATTVLATRSRGTINVSGSALVTLSTLQFGYWDTGTSTSAVNLDGGRLVVNGITRANGDASLYFNSGTLAARSNNGSFLTGLTRAEVKAGGAVIDTGTFAVTVGQNLVSSTSSPGGGLTKFGAGTLSLTGSSSYTGNTTISAGTLSVGNSAALGAAGAVVLGDANTGTSAVSLRSTVNLARDITVSGSGSGPVTIAGDTDFITYSGGLSLNRPTTLGGVAADRYGISGRISGTVGTLTIDAPRLTLEQTAANANTFTGSVVVNPGRILQLNSPHGLSGSHAVTTNGLLYLNLWGVTGTNLGVVTGTIGSLSGSGTASMNPSVSGTQILAVGGDNANGSFSGRLANGGGVMGLTKIGSGTQMLSGSNSYTGQTTVAAGTLITTTTAALPGSATAGRVVFNGGTLQVPLDGVSWTAAQVNTLLTNATKTSGAIGLDVGSGQQSFSNSITGGIGLTKTGTGTLTLTGSSSYSGRTIVNAGTVQVSGTGGAGGSVGALGTGTVSIGAGAQVTYWLSTSGSHTITNPFALTGGTLYTEDGFNTFSGPITLASGSSTISARYADTITLSGGLAGSGHVLFTQTGDGAGALAPTYVLSAPGSNTGTVRVSGSANGSGTKLQLANVNALQNATLDLAAGDLGVVEFTVAGPATYALGGLQGSRNFAIGANSLSIGGGGASTTYAGGISGSGGLTKTGTGTLTLTGSSSYSGQTTVNGGTLLVAGGVLGTGSGGGTPLIYVGRTSGQTGVFTVTSGTVAQGAASALIVGDQGTGTFNQTGGSVTLGSGGFFLGNNAGGVGVANFSGGTFTNTAAGTIVAVRQQGTINVSGSANVTLAGLQLGLAEVATDQVATVNLDGGRLTVDQVTTASGTSSLFFNGGTLAARSSNASFLSGLTRAEVKAGGAVIDTNGFGITIGQNLTANASSPGGGLTKIGAGTLTLTGSSSYSGQTTVNGGTLLVAGGVLGTGSGGGTPLIYVGRTSGQTGVFTVTSGTVAQGAASGLIVGDQGTGTFNQTGGAVTLGSGGFFLGNNAGGVGVANFSGGTFTNTAAGTVVATRNVATINVSGSANVSLAGLQLGHSEGTNTTSTVNLDGGRLAVNRVTRQNGTANFFFNGGTLAARTNSGSFMTGLTRAEVKAGGAVIDTGSFAITIGQNLLSSTSSPGGGLTKLGAGRLTLQASNSYTGATRVAAGTLAIGDTQALAGSTLDLAAGDLGVVEFAVSANLGVNTYALGGLQGSRNLALGPNTLSIGEGGASTTYAGSLSGSGGLTKTGAGTLTLSGTNSYSGGTTISAGTLEVAGVLGNGSYVGPIANAGNLLFNSASNQTISGPISGTGTLAKSGAGNLILSAAQTYTGATTVSAGRLSVNAALASTAVTVSGGELGGTGVLAGTVAVQNGGRLAPGNSIGVLTEGTTSFASGATFEYETDSSNLNDLAIAADLLKVNGNLDIAAGTLLEFSDLAGLAAQAFVEDTTVFAMINYSGAWNNGLFTYNGAPLADGSRFSVGSQLWEIDYNYVVGGSNIQPVNFPSSQDTNGFYVVVTAVPEPATFALLAAAAGVAALTRRRK